VTDFQVDIQDEYGVADFPAERVSAALFRLMAEHECNPGTSLSLVLTSDEQVQELNHQYRGVDAPTDVLSFPADPLPDEILEELEDDPYLGDLIIAVPYTLHQAEEAGHARDDEFVLLAIHGTLHLLGYDHDTPENESEMWTVQAESLAATGVAIVVPRFHSTGDLNNEHSEN
jgi:probable rRNA maturation factor